MIQLRRPGPWVLVGALSAAPWMPAAGGEAPQGAAVVATASSDGFTLQSEDGRFALQLKGLVQLDGRFYPHDVGEALTDTLLVRRARPILQGTVGKRFGFNLTPDFGSGSAVLLDAYVTARRSPRLELKVGKFKPPIGLEHLQSDPDLFLPERAFPASLEPNRDVGAQLAGDVAGGRLSYAAGIFNGTPDGGSVDLDTNDGKAAVGRLLLAPFKNAGSALKGWSVGIAGSSETQSGLAATVAGYKTGGLNTFFNYSSGVAPAGTRRRWAPEISFFGGPVGLIAEYAVSRARLLKAAAGPAPPAAGPLTFANAGWQVAGSVLITGDRASYRGPAVRRPFDPDQGRWGALQLVVRVDGFKADPELFDRGFADAERSARKASAWAVGINWFLNRNLKQAVSFERTTFTGGAKGADRPAENALLIRSELKF